MGSLGLLHCLGGIRDGVGGPLTLKGSPSNVKTLKALSSPKYLKKPFRSLTLFTMRAPQCRSTLRIEQSLSLKFVLKCSQGVTILLQQNTKNTKIKQGRDVKNT